MTMQQIRVEQERKVLRKRALIVLSSTLIFLISTIAVVVTSLQGGF